MKPILGLIAGLFLSCAPALAHEFTLGDLTIIHPHTAPTTAKSLSAAGYFKLVNSGSTDETLIAIQTDAAMAMLHASTVDANGVARMTHLADGLLIPAGQTVTLEPGGLHVMFVDLLEPFAEGAMIPATLTFAGAGSVEVTFSVEPAGSTPAHGH